MSKIQNRIKQLREKRGLRQQDLVLATGCHTSSVSKWENNVNQPNFFNASKVAKALNVTVEEIFVSEVD